MKKILIVNGLDQTGEIIEKEKHILSKTDIKIFTASSGEEALKIHKSEKADIIIADLNMHNMGINEFCTSIRKDEVLRKVSIIVICFDKKAATEKYKSCGINSFIAKPVSCEELLNKINEVLNISRRERLRVLMQITVDGKYDEQFFFSISQNISTSGALIETEKALEKGDKLTCAFFIGSDQITPKGEIVRVIKKNQDKYCYGVKFLDLNQFYRARIDKFVEGSQIKSR
ncbi:MAG: response regulator [Candidatus Mariimomonas ferrooxydans]